MTRLFRFATAVVFAGLLASATSPGQAQSRSGERIVSFDADITVNADGALSIVETIDVVARGNKIKRGIFRDFPTRSITSFGLNHIAGFRVERILRDGKPEPYFFNELAAGVRIYIGRENIRLRPGQHRYTIAYKTTRQLLFRDTEDELYWNVTGDAWDFPIETATVTVRLPGGRAAKDIAGFAGKPGATGKDFIVLENQGATLRMGTTRTLQPGEGFTIAAVWSAGAVQRPSSGADLAALLDDNRGPFIGLVLLVILLGYYITVWRRVGKDPEEGVIIPRFEAPDGLSPIAVGFIRNQGFSGEFVPGRAFTVGLTSLATKRVITISEKGSREITITKGDGDTGDLPAGERAVFDTLFADPDEDNTKDITFGRKYEPRIAAARSALMGAFDKEYARLYATKNRRHWLIGAVVALAAVFAALMADASGDGSLSVTAFMLVFAAGFSIPGLLLLTRSFPHFRTAVRSRKIGSILAGLLVIGLSLGFLVPVFGVAFMMLNVVTPAALVIAALPIIVTFCFWFWLTAPTQLGREMLDGIAGYRLYLSVAESDRLNAAGRVPEITEALFEEHLPYAMALRVEDEWTEKFEAKLEASAHDSTAARSS
jgi:hypothetical protein